MDIGPGGEAGIAVTNLLGDQLDVTTSCFVEHGCIGMAQGMQTALGNTSTTENFVESLPECLFGNGLVATVKNEAVIAIRLLGLKLLN